MRMKKLFRKAIRISSSCVLFTYTKTFPLWVLYNRNQSLRRLGKPTSLQSIRRRLKRIPTQRTQ